MEGLLKASSFNFGRMLFGDGNGTLATVSSVSDGVITLDSVKNVVEGMVIDFLSSAGAAISGAAGRRITGVDRTNKTITVTGTALTSTNVPEGSIITVQNSYGKEITGLKAIFKSTGSIYGLDRATHKWLVPYMKSSVGTSYRRA